MLRVTDINEATRFYNSQVAYLYALAYEKSKLQDTDVKHCEDGYIVIVGVDGYLKLGD